MQLTNSDTNPFALLMAPDVVFAQLEKSDCLRTLARRICKPLDDREATQAARDASGFDAVADRSHAERTRAQTGMTGHEES